MVLLLFVWGCILLGLWAINDLIVPMSIPGVRGNVINIVQVAISSAMVLLWLWTWRRLAKTMFWRALRNHQNK